MVADVNPLCPPSAPFFGAHAPGARLSSLHRRALAPALSLVLAAGGVTLTAAPATAAPHVLRLVTAGLAILHCTP